MVRMILAIAGTVFVLSSAVAAEKMTEKQKCLRDVQDVVTAVAAPETPKLGPKAQVQVDNLIEVSTHLCQQGNFKYADSLLILARSMVASE